jgi:N-acetylglucosaminyldiphosphoundecaprenol N-acetyl-beta-D-mannosaminyltransferase
MSQPAAAEALSIGQPAPLPTPLRFGRFVVTETATFPPPPGSSCWIYVTLNAEIALSLPHSSALQDLLGQPRTRVSIDGQWLLWALRRKYSGRGPAKLSGSDLIYGIARHCAAHGQRLLLLGSRAPVNAAAVRALQRVAPGLDVAGYAPAFYASGGAAEDAAHREALALIRTVQPDYIVLGLGAMKEHRLAAALAPQLDGQTTGVLCFGGAIDIAAGAYTRAPVLVQRCGIEGLYRVWQQPSRAWRLLRVLRILPQLAAGRY